MNPNITMNLPTLSVTRAVTLMTEMYSSYIRSNIPMKQVPAVFLWGPPGIGKSQGIRQLAHQLEERTGKQAVVQDIRLILFSPIDLRGVPVADENREFTLWLKPRIFAMDKSPDVINILLLDELSAAPQSVQAAAYQICLDRRVGEHTLPDNCIVICAGNRTTDHSVAYQMPKALCNRLLHFEIQADFESWKVWAQRNGISPLVIGYLSFDRTRLCMEPSPSDLAYPTPRSWQFVSDLLTTMDCHPKGIHPLICGCVGSDTAVELEAWCDNHRDLPPIEEILQGCCSRYPKTHDALFALSVSLTETLTARGDAITEQELMNVCRYVKAWPIEFAMKFFQDLRELDFLWKKVIKSRIMADWLSKNKKYFREV